MKKLRIYDFDGVLFKRPQDHLMEMLASNDLPADLYDELGQTSGRFTDEMRADPLIQPFYRKFVDKCLGETMSAKNVARLEEYAKDHTLVIASLNTRETIERHLDGSRIFHLFRDIFCSDDYEDKVEMLLAIQRAYPSYKDLTFTTDAEWDIEAAIETRLDIKFEGVLGGASSWRGLRSYVPEDRFIQPFY